jgi:hypothetical protein
MRIVLVIAAMVLTLSLSGVPLSYSGDLPAGQPAVTRVPASTPAPGMPQRFYGYVPPPPIRDTWPGGYRVIFHELFTILSEHMVGRY